MESRARIFGHAIHPMLIVFPLGLLTTGVAFDVLHRLRTSGWREDHPYTGWWAVLAYWLIATGVLGGLVAAPFGLIDWLSLPPEARAKPLGRWHGLGNVVVLALFALSWLLRRDDPEDPSSVAFVLALLALSLAVVTAWLGVEMVGRLGTAEAAQLDAPRPLLEYVFERHPDYAGRPVREVWTDLTAEAEQAQREHGELTRKLVEARDQLEQQRPAVERMAALHDTWGRLAGEDWTSLPPRQVAASRILWEYFQDHHPGGTAQMYDVWLSQSELHRRGAAGFPRRAAATCGVLLTLVALWSCGLWTLLTALLD